MMNEIYQRGPIVCSIATDSAIMYDYRSGVYDGKNSTEVDHNVEVVGWGIEDATPYWHIRNSWGADLSGLCEQAHVLDCCSSQATLLPLFAALHAATQRTSPANRQRGCRYTCKARQESISSESAAILFRRLALPVRVPCCFDSTAHPHCMCISASAAFMQAPSGASWGFSRFHVATTSWRWKHATAGAHAVLACMILMLHSVSKMLVRVLHATYAANMCLLCKPSLHG